MPTEYFEQRERALLGPRYEQLYAAPQEAAERGVTVSALRAMPEQFAQKADFPLEVSPFCKAAFVVHAPEFKPGRHPYHHAGVFYSQEPSASSAAPLLGVQPGMRVLDLCAAPGGKSSQLAAAVQGRGVLVSNEYVAARAEILKSNLERMGVPNAVVLNETPARIAEALPEFFDRVLVDAPCSGEGMFRKEPVARQQHCEALVKQCAELGAQILDCAAAALAPGGQLVYSTCTFAPEEDEGQVAAFLQRHPEFELADALGNVDYTFGSEGEANRTGGLPLDVRKVRRIWPCQGGEGHFMARLVKAGTPRTLPAAGEYTPEELLWLDAAAAAGLNPAVVTSTVEEYNRLAPHGKDPLGRTSLSSGWGTPQEIKSPPFFIMPAVAAVMGTYCGLTITPDAEVLNQKKQIIPGLYAAGEVTGGFHGASYITGTAFAKAHAFGRIAGMAMARRLL